MVIKDKVTGKPVVLLNDKDILDYIGEKCGDDIKEYLTTTIDGLNDTIIEQAGTIDSLEDEINICYAKMNEEDED